MKVIKKEPSEPKKPKTGSKLGSAIKTGIAGLAVATGFTGVLAGLTTYASPEKFTTTDDIAQQFSIVETAGGTYYGSLVKSLFTGEGEFKYLDGATYTGEFQDSMRAGEGTYTWPNGDTFTGTWNDDQMYDGTYQFADGSSFTGILLESEFTDGTFDLGSSCEQKGFSSFKATIEAGEIVSVEFALPDGTKYKGELTGKADITYPSGAEYSGQVRSGERSGEGRFVWKSLGAIEAYYNGNWVLGQMSGPGEYHFGSGTYPYLEGTFVDGRPDGKATYYKESGNTFETTWSNGKCTKVKET